MARVLISEPHPDVRRLFEHMVARLGHEPVAVDSLTAGDVADADVLLVETADPYCAELARTAHSLRSSLPIVGASIAPLQADLGLIPSAHLVKPFSLGELRTALETAGGSNGAHLSPAS